MRHRRGRSPTATCVRVQATARNTANWRTRSSTPMLSVEKMMNNAADTVKKVMNNATDKMKDASKMVDKAKEAVKH